jgi:hypothetical protein
MMVRGHGTEPQAILRCVSNLRNNPWDKPMAFVNLPRRTLFSSKRNLPPSKPVAFASFPRVFSGLAGWLSTKLAGHSFTVAHFMTTILAIISPSSFQEIR